VYHVWRSNAPMTCYDMAMPDYVPDSADNLVNQAEALAGIENEAVVPAETLAKIRTALEHDPRREPAGAGSGLLRADRRRGAGFVRPIGTGVQRSGRNDPVLRRSGVAAFPGDQGGGAIPD
jgi:hypothetical protein